MDSTMKFVQTSLTREEYEALKEALAKKGLNIREGLRKAALAVIAEELKLDPMDPFFTREATAGSGKGDLSTQHDRHLYGKTE